MVTDPQTFKAIREKHVLMNHPKQQEHEQEDQPVEVEHQYTNTTEKGAPNVFNLLVSDT